MKLIEVKSKTEQLTGFLRDEIRKCNSGNGGKILTSRALASKFSTSQTVAIKAFERLEKEGLLESRHGSGTFIRQQTEPGKSVAILNEIDISHPDTSYFYVRIVQQLRLFFRKRGIPVRLYLGHQIPGMSPNKSFASDSLIEDMERGIISGIISLAGLNSDEWRRPLIDSGLPLAGSDMVFPNGINFDMDDFVRRGADILLGKGCKNPWIITDHEYWFNLFMSIIKGKGLSATPEKHFPKHFPKHFGYSHIMELFEPSSKNKLDGLLFTDDIIFKNAMMGILELGLKVPAKLKIVTHANKGSGMFIPFPATLLEYDPDLIAEKYGIMLLGMLNGKNLTPGRITAPLEKADSLSVKELGKNNSFKKSERLKAS